MRPRGSSEMSPCPTTWPLTETYHVLGHIISPTGAIRPSWSVCGKRMWGAFFGNFGKQKAKGTSESQRIDLLKRAVRPHLTFRSSIWPPQRSMAREIDGIQKKMVSLVCHVRRHSDEPSDQYALRRGGHAKRLIGQAESWSQHWHDRAIAWDEHVGRGRNPCKWNHDLLKFHDIDWLQQRRLTLASVVSARVRGLTMWAGRNGTRSNAGKVQPRWQEAIVWAKSVKT